MKFNVSSTKLFAQLQAVSRVIAAKNSLQILEAVLFDLEGDVLTLTASDSETTIRTSLQVDDAQGSGKVAVGGKLLLETLKEFSEQPLSFQIDENNFGLNITSSNGTYSFVGANGMEYPEMPVEEGDNTFDHAQLEVWRHNGGYSRQQDRCQARSLRNILWCARRC